MHLLRRVKVVADACHVVRPVGLAVIAMAFVACVMTITGAHEIHLVLGAIIALIAGMLVFQVRTAVSELSSRASLLKNASREAERHYVDVLRRIVRFVEARNRFRCGHSERVARLSAEVARKLGFDQRRVAKIELAGHLHDLGLLAVHEKTLSDQGLFGPEDFRDVKKHPVVAHEILKPLESLSDILPAIRYHHERMNGTGYPDGLVGEQIPLEARIFAVADAYDAMTHDRPHRYAIAPAAAVSELRRCTPDGYDADCVQALAEVMNVPLMQAEPAPMHESLAAVR